MICRACTNDCDEFKSLYAEGLIFGNVTTLASILSFCTDLEFHKEPSDILPDHLCAPCVQKVAKLFVFKQMVLQADKILREQAVRFETDDVDEDFVILSVEDEEHSTSQSVVEEEITDGDIVTIEEIIQETSVECYNADNKLRLEETVSEQQYNVLANNDEPEYLQIGHDDNEIGSNGITEDEENHIKIIGTGHVVGNQDNTFSPENDLNSSDSKFKCRVCNKFFKNRKSYNLHAKRHSPLNSKTCEFCGKVYRQLQTLQRHLLSHTGEKPLRCEVCDKKFRFQSNLTAHLRQHTGERPFVCVYCEKSFGTRKHLKRHEITHQSSGNQFPCDICAKPFTQLRYLELHRLRHKGEKLYQCHLCGKSVAQQGSLRRHMLTHTGEKPFSCDICDKTFRDIKTLKIHKLHHAGIKPFECSYCEKNFSTSGQLKIHTMIHTGETPFSCDVCEKKYRSARSLQRHMVVHTGERNHVCEICGFKFRFESNLIAHKKLHTRNVAQCNLCDKDFRTEKQLERHITKRHSSQQSENCSVRSATDIPIKSTITTRKQSRQQKTEIVDQKISKSNIVMLY